MVVGSTTTRKRVTIAFFACLAIVELGSCSDNKEAVAISVADQADVLIGRADPETTQRVLTEQTRRSQTAVATCMKAKGFDYVPVKPEEIFTLGPAGSMSAEEFAAKYGFGLLTLSGSNAPFIAPADDPNLAIVDGLSASGQQQWNASSFACQDQADSETALLGVTAASQSIIEEFTAGVRADSRVIEAAAVWATCMSSQGFTYPTPSEMRKALGATAQSLMAQGAFEPSSPAHATYTAASEKEIQTAVANTKCEPEYRKVEDDVVDERRSDLIEALGT
jgi:hypothetical protein